MNNYDWVVIGGGLAGSALSYELAKVGLSVLLLEQYTVPENATRYSYGGIAYWSGTTDLTRQLCQEGIEIHRQLTDELGSTTQFRELDLLLTIAPDRPPETVAKNYSIFAIQPTLIGAEEACELEPLLNREAIAAALHFKHGSVTPDLVVKAYNQAFIRLGGTMQIAPVIDFQRVDDRIQGVITPEESYAAANIAVCAGGMSRQLLQSAGLSVCTYFTHAELVDLTPSDIQLRSIVMPAELERFALESQAGQVEQDALWDEPNLISPAVLDAGAVQFCDGRIRMGQVSRALTDPDAAIDAAESEAWIRKSVGAILPALQDAPGEWHHCLVAFSGDRLPLVGTLPNQESVHLFSGFSNPFAFLPPIARRYAQFVTGQPDRIVEQLSPQRFSKQA
jgi:glycine/D-amino acid oxidase-like deaminating enzyme